MRTLLERIVERTRNPEAGAKSALMPLATPLYAGAPTISPAYEPVVERNSERDRADTENLAQAHVEAERPSANTAVIQPAGTQQAMAERKDEGAAQRVLPQRFHAEEIAPPRAIRRPVPEPARPPERAIARRAEPAPKAGIAEPVARETFPNAAPAPSAVLQQIQATAPRPEAPVKAAKLPDARPAPMPPPVQKTVPAPARKAAYRAVDVPADTSANISPGNDSVTPVSAPQQITVSIGHIEVRAPQQSPAERPRRPGFRPSLSLSDFLKQPDGGRR